MHQDENLYREAAALWRELFPEPPPHADGSTLLDLILTRTPANAYERLRSPHLRPASIHMPGRPGA